jgi:hypothetical protein
MSDNTHLAILSSIMLRKNISPLIVESVKPTPTPTTAHDSTKTLAAASNSFTIKSVKTDFGHDRAGAMGNVFFNGKKAFEFHDDGWGGEAEINFVTSPNDDMKTAVLAFIKEAQLADIMYQNGWDFMGSVAAIDTHSVLVEVSEALIYEFSLVREYKKITRKTKNKVVFGNYLNYREISWSGVKDLADLLRYKNGREMLQKAYDDAKGQLTEGQRIFNTSTQLTALGLTL